EIRPLGGKDSIFINDLAKTGLKQVSVDLASTPGGKTGDGATDLVAIGGDDSGNQVVVTKAGAAISVSGVGATVSVCHSEGRDALVLEGLGGNDRIDASSLPAGVIHLTLRGNEGNDRLIGSAGKDTLAGGVDNDLLVGGRGADHLDGQDGIDTASYAGSAAG